jgi:hypothetical protein
MHGEARRRYADSVPPGYADLKKKTEPDAFADYIGWKQLLEYCTARETPLILITDDQKKDWWYVRDERRIGLRPELVAEYLSQSKQSFLCVLS